MPTLQCFVHTVDGIKTKLIWWLVTVIQNKLIWYGQTLNPVWPFHYIVVLQNTQWLMCLIIALSCLLKLHKLWFSGGLAWQWLKKKKLEVSDSDRATSLCLTNEGLLWEGKEFTASTYLSSTQVGRPWVHACGSLWAELFKNVGHTSIVVQFVTSHNNDPGSQSSQELSQVGQCCSILNVLIRHKTLWHSRHHCIWASLSWHPIRGYSLQWFHDIGKKYYLINSSYMQTFVTF